MQTITIQLDEDKFEALQEIAKENGLMAAEGLLRQEVERLISTYRGPGPFPRGTHNHDRTYPHTDR